MQVLKRALEPLRRLTFELGHIGPLAVLLVLMPLVGVLVLVAEAEPVVGFLQKAPGALAVFLAAGTLLAALSLVPTHAVSLVAGYVWGLYAGSGIALLTVLLAALLGHLLLSRVAGPRLLHAIEARPKAQALHQALLRSGERRAFSVVALLRLSPVMPFAGTNLLMAALGVRLLPYSWGSLIGLAPRVVALAVTGAGLSQIDFSSPGSSVATWVGIAATLLGVVLLGLVARRALRARVTGEGNAVVCDARASSGAR